MTEILEEEMIKIKMYPAKNGDSFLISIGNTEKKHILIDCGYIDTYESFLKKIYWNFPDVMKK